MQSSILEKRQVEQDCSLSHHTDIEHVATSRKNPSLDVDVKQQQMLRENPLVSQSLTPEEVVLSRRINRKMDVAMLPLMSLLYLFNGLDKGNVGNAETQGM